MFLQICSLNVIKIEVSNFKLHVNSKVFSFSYLIQWIVTVNKTICLLVAATAKLQSYFIGLQYVWRNNDSHFPSMQTHKHDQHNQLESFLDTDILSAISCYAFIDAWSGFTVRFCVYSYTAMAAVTSIHAQPFESWLLWILYKETIIPDDRNSH